MVSGTGNQLIEGEWLGGALVNGGLSQAWRQAIGGAVIGCAIGGIDAAIKGRNFWTGDFKQYDLDPALLANNDNMMADEFTFPDDATVANADDYRVYYRSEDGVSGVRNYVKPGKYIKNPIDGVATSRYANMIYKIPNGGRVYVGNGGNVKLSLGAINKTMLSAKQIIDPSYQYGWVNISYFQNINAYDYGWRFLYGIAPLIKKFPVGY